MVNINFVESAGRTVSVEVGDFQNVMQAAVKSGIDGIIGECGGELSCATCHVYVDKRTLDNLPPIGEEEAELLEFVEGVRDDSRLACQIRVDPSIEGATFDIADQGA